MADENYTFEQARIRLEEIVGHVRKKDTSLERSLDLLEEGVRLANSCTELIDHTEWRSVAAEAEADPGETAGEIVEETAPVLEAASETVEAAAVADAAEPEPPTPGVYDYEADAREPSSADDDADEQVLATE